MILRKFIIKIVTEFDGRGFKEADKSVRQLEKSSAKAARSVGSLDKALEKSARSAEKAGKKHKKAGDDAELAGKKGRRAADDWAKLGEGLKSLGPLASGVGKAIAAAVGGVVATGAAVVTVGSNFESLRARLKTVEGGAEGAADAFALIQDFTKSTPFELDQVTEAYVRLKSLGLDANRESLTAFGNVAAAQGQPILNFIEAVADASTGEFERLKEYGIKASSDGDKVAFTFQGITTTVGKNAEEIQAFLRGIGETNFAGAMDEQAKTTVGVLSNLKDQASQFLDTVAQAGVLDAFKRLLGDVANVAGQGEPFAKVLADALVRVIEAIRGAVQSITREDIEGAFKTVYDVAKTLATGIDAVVASIRWFIDISGGFEGAMVNASLAAIALSAAFSGPAGMVVAAAAAGVAIGNLLNEVLGASDAFEEMLEKVTGLDKFLLDLDRRNGGKTKVRGAPKLAGGDVKTTETLDLGAAAEAAARARASELGLSETAANYFAAQEREAVLEATGGVRLASVEGAADLATGKGAGADNESVRRAAEFALGLGDLEKKSSETLSKQAAKGKKKGKKKKGGKEFFDFEKQVADAARQQAEDYAAEQLSALIVAGEDPDAAIAKAREAGKARAVELEDRFRKAGKIFDASAKGILAALGLDGPGSLLEDRPPPQTLLITIAPIIKMVESMTINITGAGGPEGEQASRDAAAQARDAVAATLDDVRAIVLEMFALQARQLQSRRGGGKPLEGVS